VPVISLLGFRISIPIVSKDVFLTETPEATFRLAPQMWQGKGLDGPK
jgi:hypothetical protein